MADASIARIKQLSKDDVIIAVMGITGAGKSSWIQLLSDDYVQVGHDLTSCQYAQGFTM